MHYKRNHRRMYESSVRSACDSIETSLDRVVTAMDSFSDSSEISPADSSCVAHAVVSLLFGASLMIEKAAYMGVDVYNMMDADVRELLSLSKDARALSSKYASRKIEY